MTIKIPISADFNGDDIKKQIASINSAIKQMGEAVAKANGQKFEPITLQTKDDLKYFVQQSDKLLKIQGELNNRMQKSGQGNKNPFLANWSHLYLNESTRLKRQQEALVFLGASFEDGQSSTPNAPGKTPRPAPAPRPAPGGSGGGRTPKPPANPWVQQGGRIVNAGLNAAGPVGGVAAGAVSTGMASGFGAGLMGLVGGVLALGVGKAISGVMEKLDQAEKNLVDLDTLKRTIGDVNVSFEGLKAVVQANADNMGITYEEAGRLTQQFAKLGNVTADDYRNIGRDLDNGVGFSRGFGLDPQQGVSFFGQMRGMRLTSNDQDSRRMALLIGETISKSDAFAKADEVMEAIAGFATNQTRMTLSTPNLRGYTGEYSALVGSGIPGLDAQGAAGLLSRVNSALMQGGAHGEASQFFSSQVANRMGLNPIQAAIMREGGAFATNDLMFGAGSAAARFGIKGPMGDKTFLEETLAQLRTKYRDPGMLAMATSSHLGIGVNQAMALLSIKPNEMGDLQRGLANSGVDISQLKSSGIANLAKVYGSDSDRKGLAESLLRRTGKDALTAGEQERLRNAMASGSTEDQKKVLTELVATREQEKTTGSDIRESKNILDNIKTALAEKLIPLTLQMRHGIMAVAGVGQNGVTPESIQEKVIRATYDGRANAIKGRYQTQIDEQAEKLKVARARSINTPNADEAKLPRDQMLKAMQERTQKAQKEMADAEQRIKEIEGQRDKELRENAQAADGEVSDMYKSSEAQILPMGDRDTSLDALVKGVIGQESGGKHYDKNGNLISSPVGARGITQVMPKTGVSPGYGVRPLQNETEEEYRRFGRDYLNAMLKNYGGDVRKALAAYNAGPGNVDSAIKRYGDDWLSHLPRETQNYVPSIIRKLPAKAPAQLPPSDPGSSRQDVNVNMGSLEVVHKNERGEQVAPPQSLTPTVVASRPFGMGG